MKTNKICFYCLVMSGRYIENHFDDIRKFASVIEDRREDVYCTLEMLRRENAVMSEKCMKYGVNYILIDEDYHVDIELCRL